MKIPINKNVLWYCRSISHGSNDGDNGQGRSHVVPWGGRGPCKKKKYPLECVRKLIGPPYVGHLAPPYLTILLVKSHQF